MAEAEDVIVDVARHATAFAQALWRRHRPLAAGPASTRLVDVAPRLDLLVQTVLGARFRLRVAQTPAPVTLLSKLFQRGGLPRQAQAVPSTDDTSLWLPADPMCSDATAGLERLRLMALSQATRAHWGSAALLAQTGAPLHRDLYLLLLAQAVDESLARRLPGLVGPLNAFRQSALQQRPPVDRFPAARQPLERHLRALLQRPLEACGAAALAVPSPAMLFQRAARMAGDGRLGGDAAGLQPLFRDWWTGHLAEPQPGASTLGPERDGAPDPDAPPPRSARLSRRPEVRAAGDDEDDSRPGAWMVQASQPHEHAEDPLGLQRPTDRDADAAADEYAESLADLEQARLVSTPGQAREVFVSDDAPAGTVRGGSLPAAAGAALSYPEWDWRVAAYRSPGARVHERLAVPGAQGWVDQTLARHRSMLDLLRRRFEMLCARRTMRRRQPDGDELDLDACVEAHGDFRAGLPLNQAVYQSQVRRRRDMAILLLIDVSGSTDGWISAHRRVIDVEREALLLVCTALAGLGEPYAVQAFSGQGPSGVCVHAVKTFDESWGKDIALRIAGLEPDRYTRAGAALRHASATLMRCAASHRLLLMLSDGKPNDSDLYDGRYGVEDTRQAVVEARLQGISPFCLTVDRQASSYLPAVFGAHHHALLNRPERLPSVLLDWMQRLVSA